MQFEEFLKKATALPGVSGREEGLTPFLAECFRPYADEVTVDRVHNVVARIGSGSPRAAVVVHADEIGMIVTKIEDDGGLRMRPIGVDARILPAQEVAVMTDSGPLFGVIGAKPPHLLTDADRKNAISIDDLYVDIGFSAEDVKKLVHVGDPVLFTGEPLRLAGDVFAGKTLDDRACIWSCLEALKMLRRMRFAGEVDFVFSAQEEYSSCGALAAADALKPDYAIVVDVTHAETPGTAKWEAFPADRVTVLHGPTAHPALESLAKRVAGENGVAFTTEVCAGRSGTDADAVQLSSGGVPCLILSAPLRYMHTTVETMRSDVLKDLARLIALVAETTGSEWEDMQWY